LLSVLLRVPSRDLPLPEAKAHVGEQGTVCGIAVGAHFAANTKGEPTFINLDKPYPTQIFTIVIWGGDRPKFGNPEQEYSDKHVCVTGMITVFRDVAEIVAHDPAAIKLQ